MGRTIKSKTSKKTKRDRQTNGFFKSINDNASIPNERLGLYGDGDDHYYDSDASTVFDDDVIHLDENDQVVPRIPISHIPDDHTIDDDVVHAQTQAQEKEQDETQVKPSASKRKIETYSSKPIISESDSKWTITHIDKVSGLISSLLCPKCFNSNVAVKINRMKKEGFSDYLELVCPRCDVIDSSMSSPRLPQSSFHTNSKTPYEINTRLTLFSQEIGKGQAMLDKLSAVLGTNSLNPSSFNSLNSSLSAAAEECGKDALERAVIKVRQAYADLDPAIQAAMDRGEQPLIDIHPAFDGTWQKRGFTSKYGVGIVIDMLTGLAIDFEMMSKYCHVCACNLRKVHASEEEKAAWEEKHRNECDINHEGSSKAMEADAAVILWNRSIEKFNLRYASMLSDRDSLAIQRVNIENPYGFEVRKLHCLNHAHKSMGSALRKLTKDEHLGGNGVGKLTEKKCDKLQNLYRGAILDNLEDIEAMQSAIMATLYHSSSTDQTPNHLFCKPTWCWYQKARQEGQTPPSHKDHRSGTYLLPAVAQKMMKVYKRMSDENLLQRMQHGKTQNVNECLNSVVWCRAPKSVFVGAARIRAAVSSGVSNFNEGALSLTRLMNKLNLDIFESTVSTLDKTDRKRLNAAEKACQDLEKKKRKLNESENRNKRREIERAEGATYGAGIDQS